MFTYQDNRLVCQGLAADALAAEFGTPLYVYDLDLIVARYRRLRSAFAALEESAGGPGLTVAYACKANGHLAILEALAAEGASFDIVSGGELARLTRLGIDAGRAIFAGVGKSRAEIETAARAGVYAFNVESIAEAERINDVATALGRHLPIALRLNPEVDAFTHAFISTGRRGDKFGIAMADARDLLRRMADELPNIALRGFHAHIGSQITRTDRHAESLDRMVEFLEALRADSRCAGGLAADLEMIDIGGGYGIAYEPDTEEIDISLVAGEIVPRVQRLGLRLFMEPGRWIVGPAGALLTRVEYVKHGHDKRFVIVDASMTELIRPSIYGAYHHIEPARRQDEGAENGDCPHLKADVVGPVCESTDFLAKDRLLPFVAEGDILVVRDAGAYGAVMSSRYNTRPQPAEVIVRGGRARLVTPRQTYDELIDRERPLGGDS